MLASDHSCGQSRARLAPRSIGIRRFFFFSFFSVPVFFSFTVVRCGTMAHCVCVPHLCSQKKNVTLKLHMCAHVMPVLNDFQAPGAFGLKPKHVKTDMEWNTVSLNHTDGGILQPLKHIIFK